MVRCITCFLPLRTRGSVIACAVDRPGGGGIHGLVKSGRGLLLVIVALSGRGLGFVGGRADNGQVLVLGRQVAGGRLGRDVGPSVRGPQVLGKVLDGPDGGPLPGHLRVLQADVPPGGEGDEDAEQEDGVRPPEALVEDAGEGVGEDEGDDEGVEEEPGEEVGAAPELEAAEGEQVDEGGQGGEHGHGQAWKKGRGKLDPLRNGNRGKGFYLVESL